MEGNTYCPIPPRERNVFVNCPYDTLYKPILDAIVFTIHDCGFVARIALEDVGTGDVRLNKIKLLISQSRYSIHDLSRVDGEPRLNMAFEAGIFWGAKFFGGEEHANKDLLVLEKVKYRDKLTISDIGGNDAAYHNDRPDQAIECVRNFLASKSGVRPFVGTKHIVARYEKFVAALPKLAAAAHITREELESFYYFPDLAKLMTEWIKRNTRKSSRRT
ncbi:hypothetical protein ANRL3_03017 [Anaerolineae bacterium]|nr:hypothetical protein ANRL3_03017 [Anaerolineae bacterium]